MYINTNNNNPITDPMTGTSLENDLKMLRDWLNMQIHLPKEIDDELLMLFIKGCKSLELAKKKLDKFCTTNTKYPDQIVKSIKDADYRESLEFTKMFFLPDPLPDGCRIMMTLGKNIDKFNHRFSDMRMMSMFLALKRMHPDLPGLVIIMDAKMCNFSVLRKASIMVSMASGFILKNYIPVRLKLLLVYNSNTTAESIANRFVLPFVSKKILERTILTSQGVSVLKNYMPLEILPRDYPGGKAPCSDRLNEEGIKLLESHSDWFEKIVQLRADEDKRPPDAENTYGVQGTFKKLNVD